MCIWAYQNFKNTIDGKHVHERLPGLRNQNQRESILSELNEFGVVPDEVPERKVKIFEFVSYDNAEYAFALTNEARPYYDKFYALLKMFGIDEKERTSSH